MHGTYERWKTLKTYQWRRRRLCECKRLRIWLCVEGDEFAYFNQWSIDFLLLACNTERLCSMNVHRNLRSRKRDQYSRPINQGTTPETHYSQREVGYWVSSGCGLITNIHTWDNSCLLMTMYNFFLITCYVLRTRSFCGHFKVIVGFLELRFVTSFRVVPNNVTLRFDTV